MMYVSAEADLGRIGEVEGAGVIVGYGTRSMPGPSAAGMGAGSGANAGGTKRFTGLAPAPRRHSGVSQDGIVIAACAELRRQSATAFHMFSITSRSYFRIGWQHPQGAFLSPDGLHLDTLAYPWKQTHGRGLQIATWHARSPFG